MSNTDEHSLVAEIQLCYDLFVPEPSSPRPLLIALHGYGENKERMMRQARAMAPEGFAIASLQGFHQHMREPREAGGPPRIGFGWLTGYRSEESVAIHHQAVIEIITRAIDEGVADPAKVFLLGFSQTCALNFRFAFTHPNYLRGVVGICGGVPGDWETSEKYNPTDASVLYIHGTGDEFYQPSRVANYEEQLLTRASDVQVRSFEAGHEISADMKDCVREWLAAKR